MKRVCWRVSADPAWRTSSFSGEVPSGCVEVRRDLALVRDAKDPTAGCVRGDVRALVAYARGLTDRAARTRATTPAELTLGGRLSPPGRSYSSQ